MEKNVQNYADDFPTLGGGPTPTEVRDEFDSNQQGWREREKE